MPSNAAGTHIAIPTQPSVGQPATPVAPQAVGIDNKDRKQGKQTKKKARQQLLEEATTDLSDVAYTSDEDLIADQAKGKTLQVQRVVYKVRSSSPEKHTCQPYK